MPDVEETIPARRANALITAVQKQRDEAFAKVAYLEADIAEYQHAIQILSRDKSALETEVENLKNAAGTGTTA